MMHVTVLVAVNVKVYYGFTYVVLGIYICSGINEIGAYLDTTSLDHIRLKYDFTLSLFG